jgi:hypothetical protein
VRQSGAKKKEKRELKSVDKGRGGAPKMMEIQEDQCTRTNSSRAIETSIEK